MQSQLAQLIAEIKGYNDTISDLTGKVEVLQTKVDDLTGDIVETGEIGENIYYVKYSNGRLLLRGTGATYDYDLGESPFWEEESIKSLVVSEGITAIGDSVLLSMHTAQLNDEIEIVSLTDEIICDLDSVAQNNNVSIEFNPQSDSIILKNKGNEVLIYRAIYNIIENAIKYNSENGRVIVTISEENGKSVIRVEDNGKGISKEEQKKIFEPFYRVDKSRSRSLGGYGIGLAMVSEIMDIHGGTIELEKSDENGSIFCLVL